jgi:cell division protein FtsI/penicillin-binding protein 2
LVGALVVLLLVLGAVGYFVYPGHSSGHATARTPGASSPGVSGSPSPVASPTSPVDVLAQAFAQAWTSGNLAAAPYTGGITGVDVQASYATIVKALQASAVTVSAQAAQPTADQNISKVPLTVSWKLPGDQVWTYQSSVNIDNIAGSWEIEWKPSIVQPSLGNGDSLQYVRIAPRRATILDGAGQPIITDRAVVDIGLEAGKVVDPAMTANQLSGILGVNAAALEAHIKAASSDQFVDVITLRAADFAPVATQVTEVPGVILRNITEPLSPSHDFARSLLGTVGPVTKEIVDASNGRYVSGDVGGLGGLEKDFDASLGGTPGFEVDVVHSSPTTTTAPPTRVMVQPAVDGTPLRTTLDQTVEAAADAALASITTQPSALVAVRVSTGQVIAVANGPAGGGFDTALLGQVPPGSAFKIVTTTALLQQGFNVNTPVPCLPQIVVFGKTFHNYEGEQLGSVPFHTDFAKSCNTAFISLSDMVGGSTLSDTAQHLGIGACWSLGTPAFRGSVAPPKDKVDLAATSFGQGSTLVSPVSLAVAAATVARGSYLAPQLVVTGKPPDCTPTPVPPPLAANVVTHLHALMREVVTVGTGEVLAKAPGGLVMAKTGTAEYGSGDTPKTHAWLVGYQGDIAFAVYVQDGQSGGTVAAPVALTFLQNLASQSHPSGSATP